jgi:trk system potassium uptake protein TrkH
LRLRILANLGFLLQSCGLLLIIPFLVGLYYNERGGMIAVSLGCIGFLVAGFLLNALCEKRELDYKSSCLLILLAFIVMSLIGAVPYLYLDPFQSLGPVERLTNSVFESVSGFTTTGFTLIPDAAVLPQSFALFRSMTEFIGGVGVVFILLAFFQSEHALNSLGSALGIESVEVNVKKSFGMVLAVYGIYVLAFTVPVFFLGFPDVIAAVTLVIDTLTGGFSPSRATFEATIGLPLRVVLLFLMLLGSLNFKFNYHLMKGNIRKAVNEEARLYIVIIVAGSLLVALISGLNLFDSIFHVISMASATGFDYVGIPTLYDPAKTVLIVVMLVGGCAASMAGGMKVVNILWSALGIRENVRGVLTTDGVISQRPKADGKKALKWNMAISSVILFLVTLLVLSLVFSTSGVSFGDSLFEVGSALTTNGISMGATSLSLPTFYKFVLMAAMIIGKVEITIVLVSIYLGKPILAEVARAASSRLRVFIKGIMIG